MTWGCRGGGSDSRGTSGFGSSRGRSWIANYPVDGLCEGGGMGDTRWVDIFEHVVITVGQDGGRCVPVADSRKLKEGGGSTSNTAQTFVWFVEPSTD